MVAGGGSEVTTLSSSVVHSTEWMTIREDWVRHADGTPGLYGVVEKDDFVVVVPVHDGGLYLVEQYRYPVRGRYWELPQGSAPGEDPAAVAATELREQTGLKAATLEQIGTVHEAYGFATQRATVFLATDLEQGEPERGATESDMRARWFSVEQMWALVDDGRLTNAATLAAVALAQRRGVLTGG